MSSPKTSANSCLPLRSAASASWPSTRVSDRRDAAQSLVCLDPQGKLLFTDTVYPGQGEAKTAEARSKIAQFIEKYEIEAIAIGNGTGGRELESLVRSLEQASGIQVVMVNESGASVYSASEVAREEFPDYDLTVRGAVSIGRRMMDPLSELVKIDPNRSVSVSINTTSTRPP